MLHYEDEEVRKLLLKGRFGLEKENLRITGDGFFSHTDHPFPDDVNITRDFSENQTEVNTNVSDSAEEVVAELYGHEKRIRKRIKALPEPEYLWPFSNPPYIKNEEDIPVARFYGDKSSKTEYREYLSKRYGRYKMTFSGIHFNYSFSEELLKREFELSGGEDYRSFKEEFYLSLAENAVAYGWLITALTAASPLMDGSYAEKKNYDTDTFFGMASVRCSELGYWNFFAPTLDYSSIKDYAGSIERYVENGLLRYSSELYYPVRIKPVGENSPENLIKNGVSHIELRMFDLNPLIKEGIDVRDVKFAAIFLVWLACIERIPLSEKDQIEAVQNFKSAAHYDLKTVKIVLPGDEACSVADVGRCLLGRMKSFFKDYPDDVKEILDFEEAKLIDPKLRYAWIVREKYAGGFVRKGLELAKSLSEDI